MAVGTKSMNNLFSMQSKIYRLLASVFSYRPASYPYISGDGFRSMADHIYDETGRCTAQDIKDGEIVFVKTDMIDAWFKEVHPAIAGRYKLITHNSDNVVGEKESRYIDSKIIRWFAQNNIFKHEKITPIPIGIENRKWFLNGWALEKLVDGLRSLKVDRKNRILFGFNVKTNPSERTAALNNLRNCTIADEIKERVSPSEYFRLLNQYKFVASPEGNGPDCIRTWEAMILGVVPVIRNVSNNQVLSQNSLPILIINDWVAIDQELSKYESKLKSDITMFDYWKNKIRDNE